MLLLGAVDVLSGEFRAFSSWRDRITADMVVASAAIPTLFRAVRVGDGTYWDGLFSQNPPVRELVDTRPDELWVIQINPRRWDGEPRTMVEIADRRNELAGKLSLHQELGFIEKVEFLAALAFEAAWRQRDPQAVLACFADDAELVSGPPFPDRGSLRGRSQLRQFVRQHLTTDLHVDPTRKQVARDRVSWTVRAYRDGAGEPVLGRAEAELRAGKVTALRLGDRTG